jgi:hypothetical protein
MITLTCVVALVCLQVVGFDDEAVCGDMVALLKEQDVANKKAKG